MKFKKGDLVEVIWRSELYRGAVTQVVEVTNEIVVKLAKKPAIDYLFEQNQVSKVELVKVPQFVAVWISHCERWELWHAMDYGIDSMSEDVREWLFKAHDNQELFARAWLDGYEVEKEPLYYVRLPLSTWNDDAAELEVINMYVLLNVQSDETSITGSIINENKEWRTKLTEAEIKGIPGGEIYWQFAVLVEEAEA
ncbi:DUF1642 domain-containing protein [Listeria monocytogenes]|uniref:DUF1642 domain-containing protein n=1 Tax=Listeria monocytogenes TaxID=1639 RepID=UPI00247646DA|nr:DUF1642 domain-containing protein [Listeria monocytogenes]WIW07049.1 DUF1642 domain-containing protein [Listeria monocytogenes]WIW09947.1 DUF1642 domain-containing protein [Listeria monocytogenes]HCD1061936.1 DUF1642 domain-containing protein [Listeria monocytogenes]